MYYKLKSEEWKKAVEKALKYWEAKELGPEPTRRTVARMIPGGLGITPLHIIAIALFVLVVVLTGQKAALALIPVADTMYTDLLHNPALEQYATWLPRSTFIITMQVMGFWMAELGLVYFMLLNVKLVKHEGYKRKTELGKFNWWWLLNFTSIKWLMDRLPLVTVWGIVIFVIEISTHGTGSLIDRYLPLGIGMALSFLVEDLVERWEDRRKMVSTRLISELATWRSRKENMWNDDKFLLHLSVAIWETLLTVRREVEINGHKRPNQTPNLKFEFASAEDREAMILEEYQRNTGNLSFAEKARALNAGNEPRENAPKASTRAGIIEGIQGAPAGRLHWEVEELAQSIVARGLTDLINYRNFGAFYKDVRRDDKTKAIARARELAA